MCILPNFLGPTYVHLFPALCLFRRLEYSKLQPPSANQLAQFIATYINETFGLKNCFGPLNKCSGCTCKKK